MSKIARAAPPQSDPADYLAEMRRQTLHIILLTIILGTQSLVVLHNLGTHTFEARIAWPTLILHAICALTFIFSRRSWRFASLVLLSGSFLVLTWLLLETRQVAFLYGYTIIALLGCALLSRSLVILVALAATAVCHFTPLEGFAPHAVFASLFVLWACVAISMILLRVLYEALHTAWSHQAYAVRQMEEAREHRAQLMQLTKALREAREDLQHANVQLRHARNYAEESRRLKAQFAANVSHEFRTPINLIVGFSEMMVNTPEAYGTALPSAYWRDIHTIHECAHHLQSLINDVLDVSQVEAGQFSVVKEQIGIGQILREAANLARDMIVSKGLDFQLAIPDDLPVLWLDRTRMRQVILNLLGNAVRFTDQGFIRLESYPERNGVRLTVSDSGIGIAPAALSRIFDEFQQDSADPSRRRGGSGLGLALSRKFVELHGGRIWAESDGIPGNGSAFHVWLPLTTAMTASFGAGLTSFTPAPEPRCFVVMDDDEAVLKLFERYLVRHRALGARSLAEAQRLIEAVHPTAVVIDDQVEASPEVKGPVPLIRCPMPSGKRRMKRDGAADYLVKPVSRQALYGALERLGRPIEKVLVVDDDRDIVRLFSRALEVHPRIRQVWKAYSGWEGLELLRQDVPDVVILDLLMPGIDGFSFIENMQSDARLAKIPVLLTSARGGVDQITPVALGKLTLTRARGFQPVELVRCVEALVDALNPSIDSGP